MKPLPAPPHRTRIDVSLAIVNIVLLLIFFFLTSGQLLSRSHEGVALAETEGLPLERLPSPILVVHADGSWELDGNAVAPELLPVALQDLPRPLRLHLLIAGDAPAETLMAIVSRDDLADVELRLVTLHRGVQP